MVHLSDTDVTKIRCLILILLRKSETSFINKIIYVCMPYQSKVMLIGRNCSTPLNLLISYL